jgi:hypothetical protein
MIDPVEARLSAAQREYDEVEEVLLRKLPEFQIYLAIPDPDERSRYEPALSTDPDFRRWRALAAKITNLYLAMGGVA